jgi:hypothetical protein
MIIALPTTALMLSYYRRFVLKEEPFPESEQPMETPKKRYRKKRVGEISENKPTN